MKQLIIIISFLLLSLVGLSQATSVADLRVTNATTTFDVNISIGTEVYNIATKESWRAIAAVASTATLTTASGSFEKPPTGATQLSELTDVNSSTPTDKNVLIADGVDWESRAFVEADISDFGIYLTSEVDGSITNEVNTSMGWVDGTNTVSVVDANGTESVVITGFLESEVDGSITNEGSLTVAAGAANTSIINSNTSGQTGVTISGDVTIDVTESSNTITIASSMVQNVDNGAKTADFTHDAASSSMGGYTLSTSSAVTVSIHNLESGMMGTIDLDIATNPSAITVATYSDAGTTGLTEIVIGNAIANEASKMTTISYSCVNNGTSTYVKIIYGQE